MAQALRYLAVMQSPEIREVMFKSAEYKCGSCKQPKRGHWCPAEALKEQNRNVLQQLGAIEATHNIPALVLNHKLRRVAMMPPTEIETADDAPPPAQPVAAPACPQGVCKSWFEGGVCTTFWDCLLLHPPAPTLPSIPLSFPGLLQQLGPAPGVGLPPLPPPWTQTREIWKPMRGLRPQDEQHRQQQQQQPYPCTPRHLRLCSSSSSGASCFYASNSIHINRGEGRLKVDSGSFGARPGHCFFPRPL